MMIRLSSFLFSLLFVPFETKAGFFDRKAEGWHWYETKKEEKKEKEEQKQQSVSLQISPTQWVENQKKLLNESLNLALFQPSFENVKNYQILQKKMMDRSEIFSEMWQRVLFSTPSLDENTKFPITQVGRHAYLDIQRRKKSELIKKISKSYGLFFFFKGDCAYCHVFAPIVKQFSKKHNIEIIAISLDGGKVKEFPNSIQNNGAAQKLEIKAVPALIAVNPSTQKILPISYGVNSIEDLENRLLLLEEK